MRASRVHISLAIALTSAGLVHAGEFEGPYLGGKIGYNMSAPSAPSRSDEAYLGADAGYAWRQGKFLWGLNVFADSHTKSITGRDIGADIKLGLPSDRFMPYVKLGVAGTNPGTRLHGGLGMEFQLDSKWSIVGEWSGDSKTVDSTSHSNSNLSIGINYYFNATEPAHPATFAVEPAGTPESAPVATPTPRAPVPALGTVFSDKPMTIEGANFDTDSAVLKPAAFEQLDEVVEFAAKYRDSKLTVVGHTDSRGNEDANVLLSTRRAESVKAYLVSKGVDPSRIETKGMGSGNPIGDNATAEGRAQNRRVEIYPF